MSGVFGGGRIGADEISKLGEYFTLNAFLQEAWARNTYGVSFLKDPKDDWDFLIGQAKKIYYSATHSTTCAYDTIDPVDFDTGNFSRYTSDFVPQFIVNTAISALKAIHNIEAHQTEGILSKKKKKDTSKRYTIPPPKPEVPSAPDWALDWAFEGDLATAT